MAFPKGIVPVDVRVHPTPLYEAIISVGIFFFLWNIRKKKERPHGFIFSFYLILGGIERFVTEFWRLTSTVVFATTNEFMFVNKRVLYLPEGGIELERSADLAEKVFWKINNYELIRGLSVPQLYSLAMIGVGIWLMLRVLKDRKTLKPESQTSSEQAG